MKHLLPGSSNQWVFSVIEVLLCGHSTQLPIGGKIGFKTPLRGCQDSGLLWPCAVCQMSHFHSAAQSAWRGKTPIGDKAPPDFSLLPLMEPNLEIAAH